MTKIAVFVGSLREKSSNLALARSLEKTAPEGMEFEFIDIRLPLYSEDIENAGLPAEVVRQKEIVEVADGVLFVTPEYNRSVPGVLKNAIDWISRPYGKSSFVNKPIGIVGSSIGPVGTALAQADLRRMMLFQNAHVLGQPEVYVANAHDVFDETENGLGERWEKNFREYMTAFGAWVTR